MFPLPNNCRHGKFSVTPENWESKEADPTLKWRVDFYFYDDNLGKNDRIRQTGGVNRFTTLKEKQRALKKLHAHLLYDLQHRGWNPITEDLLSEPNDVITMKSALQTALAKIKVVHSYHLVIKSMLKYVFISIDRLKYDSLPIENITRLHIKQIFEDLPKHKTIFSAYTFNSYRKDLHLLFEQIVDDELVESNPVTKLKRQKATKKERDVITKEELMKVVQTFEQSIPGFIRFVLIFLYSGSRRTEIFSLKKEDVKLTEQKFKIIVKKGRGNPKPDKRTIADEVLPQWAEIYSEAKPGEYLFSVGLKPGERMIRPEQITRRWKRHVKDKLGITADFYSLKHLFLDNVAALFDIEAAQKAAGHSTPVITMNHYALGEKERQHNLIKKVKIDF
jgi:integrase